MTKNPPVGSVTVPETAGAELAGSGVRDGWSLAFSDYIWSQRRLELSFLGLDRQRRLELSFLGLYLEPETAGAEPFGQDLEPETVRAELFKAGSGARGG